jgi:hypothetical protein
VSVDDLFGDVQSIDTGADHTCALANGNVKCWGWNYYGQLGDGTNTPSNTPIDTVRLWTITFTSAAVRDGWVLEAAETSETGGTFSTRATLRVGDDMANKQYISILHFDTTPLPDNATMTKVTLKIKKASVIGEKTPFAFGAHGQLLADIRAGFFGTKQLQKTDFESAASLPDAGRFSTMPGQPGWYQLTLDAANYQFVDLKGVTQFRMRFSKDDDNDHVADFVRFYAGDAADTERPALTVEYTLP